MKKLSVILLAASALCFSALSNAVEISTVDGFSEGLAVVKVKVGSGGSTKFFSGYIDKTGKMAIKPTYEIANEFSDGWGGVFTDDKDKFIDHDGHIVFTSKNMSINSFSEGLAAFKSRTKNKNGSCCSVGELYGYIDKKGKVIIKPTFRFAGQFHDGIAVVRIGEKDSCIDKTGRVIFPFKFESIQDFSEGMAAYFDNGEQGYIDKTGKIVIKRAIPNGVAMRHGSIFQDGVASLQQMDRTYIYFDKEGKTFLKGISDPGYGFSDGVALLQTGGFMSNHWVLYNKEGQQVSNKVFENPHGHWGEGMMPVMQNGRWGYIDKKGDWVISPENLEASVQKALNRDSELQIVK
jgi:hypothetical protein